MPNSSDVAFERLEEAVTAPISLDYINNVCAAFSAYRSARADGKQELTPEMVDMVRSIADPRRCWNLDEFKDVFASVLAPPPVPKVVEKKREPFVDKIKRMAVNGADRHELSQAIAREIDSLRDAIESRLP